MSVKTLSSHRGNRRAIVRRRFFAGPSFSRWRGTDSLLAGALVLLLGLLAVFSPPAQAAGGNFGGGTGAAGNPYLVEDAADLAAINNDVAHLAAYYKLKNDIDLSAWLAPGGPGYNDGAGWVPIGPGALTVNGPSFSNAFTGNFDGAGHKITGLWTNNSRWPYYANFVYVGLFGCLGENAAVLNLGVEIADAGINGGGSVGGLAGISVGNISNSYATGRVSGAIEVGGLVGWQSGGSIINSYASGNVSGSGYVGGLVGHQLPGVGITSEPSINNSYSTGSVSSISVSLNGDAGGLVGAQLYGSSITNSYASGSVTATNSAGGLVGRQLYGGSITNTYATGSVTGSHYAGGLVGEQDGGAITASFFDLQTTGQTNGVGSGPTAGVTGKTTLEMQTQATFTAAGWDFTSAAPVWFMPRADYPKLTWQPAAGKTYTISTGGGAGCTISPASATVAAGATRAFTVTAKPGYFVAAINGCNGTEFQGDDTSITTRNYTTGAVTGDCWIFALCTPTYTITATAGVGGTISPAFVTARVNTNYTFTVTPNPGYYIASISGCAGTTFTGNSSDTTARSYSTAALASNCTVSASFRQVPKTTYSVTTNGGPSCTFSPASATVNEGESQGFSVMAKPGYFVAAIDGCNGAQFRGDDSSITTRGYNTGAVTGNCEVVALCVPIPGLTYTVTANAGAGGSISPASAQVNPGATQTFTVTPSAGYYIAQISGCNGATFNGSSTTARSYSTGPVTSNCTVSASFRPMARITYTVTGDAGDGGSISPASALVASGMTQTLTVTPSTGYYIARISGCNGTPFNGSSANTTARSYSTGPVTSHCTVTASFSPVGKISHTVTVSSNPPPLYLTCSACTTPTVVSNGTITPSGQLSAPAGSVQTFTVTPNPGYTVAVGGTCGGSLNGNIYTTHAITADCTVVATFSATQYPITVRAGAGGTLTPLGQLSVPAGSSQTLTVTPNPGYTATVGGTCGGTLSGNTYTTHAITGFCTVEATFAAPGYTITASAIPSGSGSIGPAGAVAVNPGGIQAFTITPAANHALYYVTGTCGGMYKGNTYTTQAVNNNCTVTAVFK